jgi:hypothetical protein
LVIGGVVTVPAVRSGGAVSVEGGASSLGGGTTTGGGASDGGSDDGGSDDGGSDDGGVVRLESADGGASADVDASTLGAVDVTGGVGDVLSLAAVARV